MTSAKPILHMICGKMAAGKSTLSARLGAQPATLVIAEDFWTSTLFKPDMHTVDDYIKVSRRLRAAMAPHVEQILRLGLSVVLDFPANTISNRQWMRSIFEGAGADHRLHWLDMPDDLCRARLHQRNAEGRHEFAPTDADFDLITSYFVPPSAQEGFHLIRYDPSGPIV